MDDDVRIEPGISLWKLFLIMVLIYYALTSGSVVFLGVAVYFLFSAVVGEGFWPYLTQEQAREIRRK
jgi:hypothetical protein